MLQLLIVFLALLLTFALHLYIRTRWAMTFAVLFVAGVGWYVWHNENYMTVSEEYASIYSADHRIEQLEIVNTESQENFMIDDESTIDKVLSGLGSIKGKREETVNADEYEYILRFMVKRPSEGEGSKEDFHYMYVSEDRIGSYKIIEGKEHLRVITELEKEKEN